MMTLEEMVAEINRLRTLVGEHRKIGEEAEAEVRRLRRVLQQTCEELTECHNKLRRAAQGNAPAEILAIINGCELFVSRLKKV